MDDPPKIDYADPDTAAKETRDRALGLASVALFVTLFTYVLAVAVGFAMTYYTRGWPGHVREMVSTLPFLLLPGGAIALAVWAVCKSRRALPLAIPALLLAGAELVIGLRETVHLLSSRP